MGLMSSRTEPPPLLDAVPPIMKNCHVRQGSTRARAKPPMPDPGELERRFIRVLASMDLPPDKAKLLKSYDLEKKWEIICDQDMVQAKDAPKHYLNKLRTYLDPKASRSHRKRKMVGESTSTQVLRDLEISLRTNNIEWVREFLDESNQGLDVLIDYLSFRLSMMRHEQRIIEARNASNEGISNTSNGDISINRASTWKCRTSVLGVESPEGVADVTVVAPPESPETTRRRSRHAARLKMGAATDDIHVCIMCMRAIMNNKYGFNMVIQHREAINSIALSLLHRSLRTKALVLELLAAICLVKGGHQIILSAFDNFKQVVGEERRFHTLMEYFMNYENFHIEFMVACMQFVNIVVHSVEDMNFRVHLQYEFTTLRLDQYLDKLRLHESEDLQVQISAYLDNVFDVAALMEDSETKTAALERVNELEDELAHCAERLSVMAVREEHMAVLEAELSRLRCERDALKEARQKAHEEVSTLRRAQMDSRSRQSMLENKLQQLETITRGASMNAISSYTDHSDLSPSISPHSPTRPLPSMSSVPPPPSASCPTSNTALNSTSLAPCPAPPPPPPPTAIRPPPPPAPPAPPPAPGLMATPLNTDAMTIKRKVHTRYKLPTLNWIALKPNQVRGTVFNDLDDDKILARIDLSEFEERFKLGPALNGCLNAHGVDSRNSEADDSGNLNSFPSKRFKKPDTVSLLEHTRLRNIAISRRKLDIPVEKAILAINSLDLKQIPLESVEILQRMVPTEPETKAYKEYLAEKKNISLLTEEDKFLMQLAKVERISTKLSVMSYMGNFYESIQMVTPQIHAIIAASSSVRTSQKFRGVLEVVLAFGNYLNSSKRGPAYGFKLQSLDTLCDTKSSDKRMSLLHYIVSTIRSNFSELLNFETELHSIDRASQVSLDNVLTDVTELERGVESVRRECADAAREWLVSAAPGGAEHAVRSSRSAAKAAQDAFAQCLEFYGEASRGADAAAFFAVLQRFIRAFKTADQENEQRRRLELAAMNDSHSERDPARSKLLHKKNQDAVISELKTKSSVSEKKLLQQDEVYNGALEDILLGLRSEPYRRADAVRRSHRRRINSHRLSKGLDELDI